MASVIRAVSAVPVPTASTYRFRRPVRVSRTSTTPRTSSICSTMSDRYTSTLSAISWAVRFRASSCNSWRIPRSTLSSSTMLDSMLPGRIVAMSGVCSCSGDRDISIRSSTENQTLVINTQVYLSVDTVGFPRNQYVVHSSAAPGLIDGTLPRVADDAPHRTDSIPICISYCEVAHHNRAGCTDRNDDNNIGQKTTAQYVWGGRSRISKISFARYS